MRGGERLLDRLLRPDDLERVVDAAPPAQRLHAGHRILFRGVDDVRGAEFFRPPELLLHHIDRDDLARAHQPRHLDRIEAHATASPHGDAGARLDLRTVEHRAGAREHAAAHEARDIEGHVLADRDDAHFREHGVRRVARDLQEVVQALAILLEARRAVEHEPARLVAQRAHRGLAADAVPARAARRDVARADVIAGLHRLDAGANPLDHARGLVAEHDGQGMRRVTGDHVQVAVADAVRGPLHQHLVRAGLHQLHVFDDHRLLHFVENGGFGVHGLLL